VAVAADTRPRGARALLATPPRAIAMTMLAGGAISLQSYLNGRLGGDVGSPTIAAAINNVVAMVATTTVVLATGALPRAVARLRALGRPPAWQFLGGLAGASLVLVSAAAAPEVGVALLTVALVCGYTGGSLAVDAFGLGPPGRRPVTVRRVGGVVLASAATAISALGARGDLQPLLLGLAVAAGAFGAVQAAANGQLARKTGEPFVASLVNTTVGMAALGGVGLVALATVSLHAPPANPLLYVGGLLGAFVVVVTAMAVQTLSVLRVGLATVAGQTSGALVIDLVAPAPGEAVTAATVLGVVLTLAAVAISGRSALTGRRSARRRASGSAR
jgi:bacterial/archaeal transporter family-2 protein